VNGKPQDCMNVGIVHFMAFPDTIKGEGPILQSLECICNDDYFGAVEVTSMKDAEVRRKAIELVKKAGMAVGFGAQPVILINKLDLNSTDAGERAGAVEAVKRAMDEAVEWQPAGFAVLSGPDPGPERRAEAKSALIESLKELCGYSAERGELPVLLETFDRKPFGKNCLIGPTEEAVAVADCVASEFSFFGLMLDLSHMPLLEETADQMLRTAAPFLKHIHVGNCIMKDPDNPAYGDGHPRFGAPGGENDVEELAQFLRVLGDVGYIGPGKRNIVSFEVKPYGSETPEDVITGAKETMDKAWEKV